jgi:hypothetical protein
MTGIGPRAIAPQKNSGSSGQAQPESVVPKAQADGLTFQVILVGH